MNFLLAEISVDCSVFIFSLMQCLPLHALVFPSLSLPSSHMSPLLDLVMTCYLIPKGMHVLSPLPGISTHLLILDLSLTNPYFSRNPPCSPNCPVLLKYSVPFHRSHMSVYYVMHFSFCDYSHNVFFCQLDCEQGLLSVFFLLPPILRAGYSV